MKDEKGFLKFSFYQDVEDMETFHLIEEWETSDDLDTQLKSDAFRVLMGALKVLSEEAEVKYHIGSLNKGVRIDI